MENIKPWNKPISSSFEAILEDVEQDMLDGKTAPAATATLDTTKTTNDDAVAADATKSTISDDLKTDDEFKNKIKLNFEKGNPTIIYKDKLYELVKGDGGKCIVSELTVGINNKFKMYSAALGGKLYEMIVSPSGIIAKPLASAGLDGETAVATLSDDSSTGSEEIIDIYLLDSTKGTATGAIRINGENIKGNLTESKGADEFKILKKILTDNKTESRTIVRAFKVDSSTIDSSCSKLYRAMHGAGTDEDALNSALKRLSESENASGNWMMMLYGWDQNRFGTGSANDPNDMPVAIRDFLAVAGTVAAAVVTGVATVGTFGGYAVVAALSVGAAGMIGAAMKSNISFNKSTPIYRHNDDTDLDSNHRGLLMDICNEMEDAWTSEQTATAGYLKTLTAGLPDDDFRWELVDAATGEVLVTSGKTKFFKKPENKGKTYLMTCKSFKQKYTNVLGDLLGDDEYEGA